MTSMRSQESWIEKLVMYGVSVVIPATTLFLASPHIVGAGVNCLYNLTEAQEMSGLYLIDASAYVGGVLGAIFGPAVYHRFRNREQKPQITPAEFLEHHQL